MTFSLTLYDLCYFDEASRSWRVRPGSYRVLVGAPSAHLPAQAAFTLL